MVTRFGATPGAPFFVDLVNGEAIAVGLMLDFAAALGMSEADLQAYEPRPQGQTYPHFAAWLAFYASDADIAAAYLVNFPVFGENTGRMGAALRPRYGFTAEQTAFFDFFSSLPPTFEPAALAIIEAGLNDRPSPVHRARRAAAASLREGFLGCSGAKLNAGRQRQRLVCGRVPSTSCAGGERYKVGISIRQSVASIHG